METLDDRIESFLLDLVGFCDAELIKDFRSIVDDIANTKN
jgi:hypothetical protein